MSAAIISLCGLLIAGYLSNFVAEDYRRFRDGSALAAALRGELYSYDLAFDQLLSSFTALTLQDNLKDVPFYPIDVPKDPVFENGVGKLGLLDLALVADVVFVYEQIRAFRSNLKTVQTNYKDMSDREIRAWITGGLAALTRARSRSPTLLVQLENRACRKYSETWSVFFKWD